MRWAALVAFGLFALAAIAAALPAHDTRADQLNPATVVYEGNGPYAGAGPSGKLYSVTLSSDLSSVLRVDVGDRDEPLVPNEYLHHSFSPPVAVVDARFNVVLPVVLLSISSRGLAIDGTFESPEVLSLQVTPRSFFSGEGEPYSVALTRIEPPPPSTDTRLTGTFVGGPGALMMTLDEQDNLTSLVFKGLQISLECLDHPLIASGDSETLNHVAHGDVRLLLVLYDVRWVVVDERTLSGTVEVFVASCEYLRGGLRWTAQADEPIFDVPTALPKVPAATPASDAPTATPPAGGLPDAGAGPGGSSALPRIVIALALAGVALIVGARAREA